MYITAFVMVALIVTTFGLVARKQIREHEAARVAENATHLEHPHANDDEAYYDDDWQHTFLYAPSLSFAPGTYSLTTALVLQDMVDSMGAPDEFPSLEDW